VEMWREWISRETKKERRGIEREREGKDEKNERTE
jgi:hypothetical protein